MAKNTFWLGARRDNPFVLLAEDDDNDAFAMELAFRKAGLEKRVWRVRNGAEVIDYLGGHGKYADRTEYPLPSLLMLDLKMSGLDGFDVLRCVRANPRSRHLVVVVLTDSHKRADMAKAYQLGANSYLLKPAGFLQFASVLELLVGYWSMNQVPSSPRRSRPIQLAKTANARQT